MKQIIIIINDYGYINGGAGKVAIQSAIELSKLGYNVIFFCAVGPIDEELKKSVYMAICLNQSDILNNRSKLKASIQGVWNQKAYNALNSLLHEKNKYIVHIHGWSKALSSSVVKACNDNGLKPFISIHDYFSVCPNGGFFNYKKKKICSIKPVSLKCLICNCDSRNYVYKCWRFIRQKVQDKYIKNNPNIRIIYLSNFSLSIIKNYLHTSEFYYLQNPIEQFNIKNVSTKRNSLLLYVGRISPEKGVDLFCQAITDLRAKGVVIGDGPEKKQLEKKYKNILFTGWLDREEITNYAKKTKALIFPSRWYEVSPLTSEEFLQCGIPVIVSNQCAAKESITEGINGFIFKSGDLESLKSKITLLLSNKQENLFEVSSWHNNSVSNSKHIKELLKIYNNSK